jgi:hypothetical protein
MAKEPENSGVVAPWEQEPDQPTVVEGVPEVSPLEKMFQDAEVVEEDFGEEVDWAQTPMFAGVYTGNHKEIEIAGNISDDGEVKPSHLYGFLEIPSGARRALWAPFQIQQAMEQNNIVKGDALMFRHEGKRQSGLRQINIFTIKVIRNFGESVG